MAVLGNCPARLPAHPVAALHLLHTGDKSDQVHADGCRVDIDVPPKAAVVFDDDGPALLVAPCLPLRVA